VRQAFAAAPDLVNLLLDPGIQDGISKAQSGWRRTVSRAADAGIPMLAHTTALGYFDSYRTARLPQGLTQAQRDAFGAHTYERVDRPGAVHSEW
jgi:6-phosphogluconate dehydrogenase